MIRTHAQTLGLVVLAFVAGIAVNQYSVVTAQSNMVYELRTYTTNEGKLPLLLDRFGGGETDPLLEEFQGLLERQRRSAVSARLQLAYHLAQALESLLERRRALGRFAHPPEARSPRSKWRA